MCWLLVDPTKSRHNTYNYVTTRTTTSQHIQLRHNKYNYVTTRTIVYRWSHIMGTKLLHFQTLYNDWEVVIVGS